jgi:prepilin-type N-terminal cleavage/methylation domain-containing protein
MKKRTQGVTLIELLIAVSLLSLLSVGMLMALRVGLNSLDKANGKLMANRRSTSVQRILRNEIEGFIPVGAECPGGQGAEPVKVPFFDGRPQSLRLVSDYSLEEAFRGLPRILEFQVIAGDKGAGVRLVVNEFIYTGPRAAGASCLGIFTVPETGVTVPRFAPVEIGPRSFVLADKLAYCRFNYRRLIPVTGEEQWVPAWTWLDWPSAVRVEMASLEPDPSRVPLVTATMPIRVNRRTGVAYEDH